MAALIIITQADVDECAEALAVLDRFRRLIPQTLTTRRSYAKALLHLHRLLDPLATNPRTESPHVPN